MTDEYGDFSDSDSESIGSIDDLEWDASNLLSQGFNLKNAIKRQNVDQAEDSQSYDLWSECSQQFKQKCSVTEVDFWAYIDSIAIVHYKFGRKQTHDEFLKHDKVLEEPATKIPKNLIGVALKCFRQITLYAGDNNDFGSEKKDQGDILKVFLNSVCGQTSKLRDEIFIQLLKQIRGNPDKSQQSPKNVWYMFACLASCCSPSEKFLNPLQAFLNMTAERDPDSLNNKWAKIVFVKIFKNYQLLVRRTHPCSREECQLIIAEKKTRLLVYLMNGAYVEMFQETWETFENLKPRMMDQLGIDNKYMQDFGFLEVCETRKTFEERWLENFFSVSDVVGFMPYYTESKPEKWVKNIRVYFTLRMMPKNLDEADDCIREYVWMTTVNDMIRGKIGGNHNLMFKAMGLVLQAYKSDCPDKANAMAPTVQRIKPRNASEQDDYWVAPVTKSWQGFKGNDKKGCIEQFFALAEDFEGFLCMQFSGKFIRCSNDDEHDANIPEDCDSVFMVDRGGFNILNPSTASKAVSHDIKHLSNWGCSKDQFVYATGEAHARIKEYFKCPSAHSLCWLLNVYACDLVDQEPNYLSVLEQNHIHLPRTKRHVSIFQKEYEEQK